MIDNTIGHRYRSKIDDHPITWEIVGVIGYSLKLKCVHSDSPEFDVGMIVQTTPHTDWNEDSWERVDTKSEGFKNLYDKLSS